MIKAQEGLEFQSMFQGVCWHLHKHSLIRDIGAFRASQQRSSWKVQSPKDFFHFPLFYHRLTKGCTNITNLLQLSFHHHTLTSSRNIWGVRFVCKMQIFLLVLLNETYLKKCNKFHVSHRYCHFQTITKSLESILDDRKLVES